MGDENSTYLVINYYNYHLFMRRIYLLCLLLAGNMLVLHAQQKPFVLGVTDQVTSAVLGENRVLNIYLPEGYDKDTAAYPVIYLLDGSANEDFIHVTGLVQFLTMIRFMPPAIIVGIANVDRKRDFTFPTRNAKDKASYPSTGASARFISFIEKELQPYVQQHYRTGTEKMIVGQSLGGLLATEILLKKPSLFNQYVIISPSLWWDDESLLAAAPELLRTPVKAPLQVYLAVGTEGKQMEDDAAALSGLLHAAPANKLKINFVPFPQENHLTILHRSLYNAFETLYHKPAAAKQ